MEVVGKKRGRYLSTTNIMKEYKLHFIFNMGFIGAVKWLFFLLFIALHGYVYFFFLLRFSLTKGLLACCVFSTYLGVFNLSFAAILLLFLSVSG
jgi:hypothetical protein